MENTDLGKMSIINPLEGPEGIIIQGRRVGNTTRIADYCIQMLFDGKAVIILDHHESSKSNDRLYRIICRRLSDEHGLSSSKSTVATEEISYNGNRVKVVYLCNKLNFSLIN